MLKLEKYLKIKILFHLGLALLVVEKSSCIQAFASYTKYIKLPALCFVVNVVHCQGKPFSLSAFPQQLSLKHLNLKWKKENIGTSVAFLWGQTHRWMDWWTSLPCQPLHPFSSRHNKTVSGCLFVGMCSPAALSTGERSVEGWCVCHANRWPAAIKNKLSYVAGGQPGGRQRPSPPWWELIRKEACVFEYFLLCM